MGDPTSYGLQLLAWLDPSPSAKLLAPGQVLVEQHERGSDVFVVLEGTLEATIETDGEDAAVARFGRGQLFGELTALAGGARTATVRATEQSAVAVVGRSDFAAWLGANPGHDERVAARARERVDKNHTAAMLARILGTDNHEVLDALLELVTWRTLEADEVLCREGDPPDSAYLVLSGRLAVTARRETATSRVELGRNAIVGELGALDRLPRSATITALRRTRLAELPADAIDRVIEHHPTVAITMLQHALRRVQQPQPRNDRAGTIALIFTDEAHARSCRELVASELERHGPTAVLDAASIDKRLGQPGVAQSEPGTVGVSRLDALMHDLETTHEHLVLVGDPEATEWTLRAAQAADRTLIVTPAGPRAETLMRLDDIERVLKQRRVRWWRLIMHPSDSTNPARHRASLADCDRILHARIGHVADIRRATRLISGNGVGLALGGGGARGFGHAGAYRALLEAGIEPDVIVGTSIGSVFGAAIALDLDADEVDAFASERFGDLLDWTVPIVSFLKGERITRSIRSAYRSFRCESLWRPFGCVVTNLTRSRTEVRTDGPLDRAVRMSVSIPAVLPPLSENGEVFVDGGVLNNLPADVLSRDPAIRRTFAVDVSPQAGPRVDEAINSSVSGLSVLVARAVGRKGRHPTAASIVMQTMVAGSGRDRRSLIEDGCIDHYMHLRIEGSSLLGFDNVRPVITQGYESARARLAEMFPDGYDPAGPRVRTRPVC